MNTHRQRQVRPLVWALIALGGMVMLLWMVYVPAAILQQSRTNGVAAVQAQQAAKSAAETARAIEDCTSPGGTCFRRGERRTATAVSGIQKGTLAVVAAALSCQEDGITEQRALARCTIDRLPPRRSQ